MEDSSKLILKFKLLHKAKISELFQLLKQPHNKKQGCLNGGFL